MNRFQGRHPAALLLLALAACQGASRGVPEEILPYAADTLTTEWADIPSAAALSDGRWVVVSAEWDAAVFADFRTRTLAPIGGPRQKAYLHPFLVFVAADTIYLGDWGKRRTTVWTAEGRLVDSIPVADALRGAFVRGRDGAGQLYFQVDPKPKQDGSGNQDSIALARAPRSLARFDTVGSLAPRDLAAIQRENSLRFETRVFSGSDVWGVWPDGSVWIARRYRNQVVTIDARGTVSRSPPLPDPVYEVTEADRERYLQGFPAEVRPKETEIAFALLHPPFTAGFSAPDHSIWLEKSKTALDSLRRIQVLDRAGLLQRLLVLHGPARLIAVGTGKILVAEQFGGGIRLMEVLVPRPAPR